ncbi:uncharacterized protein LOC144144084 isoform X2 [Haemaphysalis longicornis]
MVASTMPCILSLVLIALLRQAQGSEEVDTKPYPGLHFRDPDPKSVAPLDRYNQAMEKSKKDCELVRINGNPDNLPSNCHVPGYGYQGEYYWQPGKCEGEKCVILIFPPGCKGKEPTPTTDGQHPIGCGFLCNNDEDGTQEYGFYPAGTPCRHWIGFERFEELKCIPWQNITVCRDKTPVPPGC